MVEQKVKRQHRLPAAVIAQFADLKQPKLRESRVSVRRRGGVAVRARADNLCRENYAYDFTVPRARELMGESLEHMWHVYEAPLPKMLENLAGRPATNHLLSERDFVGTLFPYMAGAMVRGGDFDSARPRRSPDVSVDNVNIVRITAWQRAQADLLHCNMTYVSPKESADEFILGDIGWSIYPGSDGETPAGLWFPLSPRLGIVVTRMEGEASWKGGAGSAGVFINEGKADASTVSLFNRQAATFCMREIYGRTNALLDDVTLNDIRRSELMLPEQVTRPHGEWMTETMNWQQCLIDLNLRGLAKIWDCWL